MSYCRFEGTKQELMACLEDAREHVNGEAEEGLSERELRSFKAMLYEFVDFLNDMELLDENGELYGGAMEWLCNKMKEGGRKE